MTSIDHLPPEENYGGEYDYYSDECEEEYYEEEEIVEDDDVPVASGGMAAMIAAAAFRRNKRIDGGGEVKIRDVVPAPAPTPDKQDFAAMAAAAASQRKERIQQSGGTLQITEVREIPEEHARVFVSVAEEAANIGRLVRSNEHVVEAQSHRKEEKDTWSGPGGLKNQENSRSIFQKAINEAAALGRMKASKYNQTQTYDRRTVQEEEEEVDIDKIVDDHGRRALRTHYLLDKHVREEHREKRTQWESPESFDEPNYTSIDDVELPTEEVPSFKRKDLKFMTQREALDAIAKAVATNAWERNYRLQRPKAQLRVTRVCKCPYCKNPNPYQTHKYKKMASGNSFDDPSSAHPQQSEKSFSSPASENLPHLLKPPEGKIYMRANPADELLEEEHDQVAIPNSGQGREPSVEPEAPPENPRISMSDPCSIYKIRPSGGLKPVPYPEETMQSSVETLENDFDMKGTISFPDGNTNGAYYASSSTGTRVLLNECVDFGTRHKRVHIKREKKKKEKKTEKAKEKEGCFIM